VVVSLAAASAPAIRHLPRRTSPPQESMAS
jgi:hypothetical protein